VPERGFDLGELDRPFIVCDPRRRQSRATVRSAENYETGMSAFTAATGGVAIRASRNLSSAAAWLGMAPVSLSRWIGRRKLPMHAVT